MPGSASVIVEDRVRIPVEVHALDRFREWSRLPVFPDRGRIDFLDGDIEVDMSPEDLYTHGIVKTALVAALHRLITETDRGNVFVDRTRVTSPEVGLSAEPDVVVVLWDSLEAGRVREVPAAGKGSDRFIELEGAPDLVVEIVSDGSERKDRERLPRLYEKTGISELWTVDARGEQVLFQIQALSDEGYEVIEPGSEGYTLSRVVGLELRLSRERSRQGRWRYRLEQLSKHE